jgi:hypothetical protein
MARLKPASWSMISGSSIILLCEAVSTRKRSPTRRWSRRMGIARTKKTCLRLPQMENVSIRLIPAIRNNVLGANYREVQIYWINGSRVRILHLAKISELTRLLSDLFNGSVAIPVSVCARLRNKSSCEDCNCSSSCPCLPYVLFDGVRPMPSIVRNVRS